MSWGPYGAIVDTGVVSGALLARLNSFLPAYLELVAQNTYNITPGKIAKTRSWEVVPLLDLSDEPQMPAIKIVAPGPSELPVADGEGNIRATYEMNVVAIVTAKTESETTRLRDIYAAAIVACVMQKRSLGDRNVRGTVFGGNDHFDLPSDERRTKQAVSVRFTIEYEHIVMWKLGLEAIDPGQADRDNPQDPVPVTPPVDPNAPPPDPIIIPDADHIDVTVDPEQ